MPSKQETIDLMAKYFPKCPICKTGADYEGSSLYLVRVRCRSCKAQWESSGFMGGKEITCLKLLKPDRQEKSKPFVKKEKVIRFWQSIDFEKFDPAIEREVKKLLEKVGYGGKYVDGAISRLKEIGEPALYELNLLLTDDRGLSAGVVHALVHALGLMANERTEEMLLRAFKEKPYLRSEIVTSLVLIEEKNKTGKLVDPIIKALREDEDPTVRATAAQALAFIKWDPRVTEALIQALKDYETYYYRKSLILGLETSDCVSNVAALALGKIGSKRALEVMVPYALTTWHEKIAVEAFMYIGEPAAEYLVKYLDDERDGVRKAASASLKAIKRPKIDVLKNMGESGVEPLIKALNDDEVGYRQSAAFALREMGDERALDALNLATKDKRWFVRSAAKGAIKEIQKRQKGIST